jgi:ABC-type Fe3+-siderophore transport system permease subunit
VISQAQRFPIFIAITLIVFIVILRFVTRNRSAHPSFLATSIVAAIVVVGGMLFAKLGQNAGWPWWVYYTVPAAVTLVLPPVAFRLNSRELWQYLVLAFVSSPIIHVSFSLLLGWHDYMPFLPVPSIQALLGFTAA